MPSTKKQLKTRRSLEALINALPDDPDKVKSGKKPSVKDAIISLKEQVGSKVFTKRQLQVLVETAFPELAPVAFANVEASLERAKAHVDCVKKGDQNIYRFK